MRVVTDWNPFLDKSCFSVFVKTIIKLQLMLCVVIRVAAGRLPDCQE